MRYVIGDLHGCIKTFDALLSMIDIAKEDEIYFLGDYIDRGPDSKSVIDRILNLIDYNYKVFSLKGNHEDMLLNSLYSTDNLLMWKHKNGGDTTLDSFGVTQPNDIPKIHLNFISELASYFKLKDYVLVHGGMNFEIDDPFGDLNAMLWERNELHEIKPEKIGNRKLIVGHTPSTLDTIKKSIKTNKIMLDGGCVYNDKMPELGYLCALELDSGELIYLKNCENSII